MLINTSCSLFIMSFFRQLMRFIYICCNITLSFLINSAGRYLFHELCLPWYTVHHSLPPVQKCKLFNNVRTVELPDFWPPNSRPGLNTFHYNNLGQRIYHKKYRMWMIWGGICLTHELECNRALLMMALINGADVSKPAFELQEDSFHIHRDIN